MLLVYITVLQCFNRSCLSDAGMLLNLLFSALAHRRMVGELLNLCSSNIDKTTAAPFTVSGWQICSNIWIFKVLRGARVGVRSVKSCSLHQQKSHEMPSVCFAVAGTSAGESKVYVWDAGCGDWLLSLDHGGKWNIWEVWSEKWNAELKRIDDFKVHCMTVRAVHVCITHPLTSITD